MRRVRLGLLVALCVLAGGCLPAEVKRLNALGDAATMQHRYDDAIVAYEASLKLRPGQSTVLGRLSSARVLLRQGYVWRIYGLVDRPEPALGELEDAWMMLSRLPSLRVEVARAAEIQRDLVGRFARIEAGLRGRTPPHRYFGALDRMQKARPDRAVGAARAEVGAGLEATHAGAIAAAERSGHAGLALLEASAAARFSPAPAVRWAEVARRQALLRRALAEPLTLVASGARAGTIEGALSSRLPEAFSRTGGAELVLELSTRTPQTSEQVTRDRASSQCQTGTRREPNPECPTLEARAEDAARDRDAARRAVEEAGQACKAGKDPGCAGKVAEAERALREQAAAADKLSHASGRCARTIEVPVYQTFFFEKRTVRRAAVATASLRLSERGRAVAGRELVQSAEASDLWSDGLSCAGIAPDPLELAPVSALAARAEQAIVEDALAELRARGRQRAEALSRQGTTREARLDALVRARLVDGELASVRAALGSASAEWLGEAFGLEEAVRRATPLE